MYMCVWEGECVCFSVCMLIASILERKTINAPLLFVPLRATPRLKHDVERRETMGRYLTSQVTSASYNMTCTGWYWIKKIFYILPMMPFLVLLQNQIHSTRPVLAQENENFADVPCGPGKADGEEEIHKDWIISEIKSAYSASTLWTQMHTGGENPCRLMKLIMRNHSSSMRSNDERADPHMWILIVQYKRWTTQHENLISCRTATGCSI